MTVVVRRSQALLAVAAAVLVASLLTAGAASARDAHVRSFDQTRILVHFFPAAGLKGHKRAPTLLMGPGWGQLGSTDPNSKTEPASGVAGIGPLRRNGYNVLTWDPRGFGGSGGTAEVDSPKFEARDVSAIISWVARQRQALLDHRGDPRVGMVGGSYGGGIQLVSAAIDHRIDAIVPDIAWHSLVTSLGKNDTAKSGWGIPLYLAALSAKARLDSHIVDAANAEGSSFQVSAANRGFYAARGPGDLVDKITAPTLLIQGTVDTLFTLAEADANAKALIAQGVPTKVVWYCGGHGGCISSTNDGEVVERATLDWLDRYVKDDLSVVTGPQFEWVDQHGTQFSAKSYPVATGTPLEVSSEAGGTLPLRLLFGGSGPNLRAFEGGLISGLLGILSGAEATTAVELTLPAQATTTYIVGAPELEFTYSGTGSSRHVYAQLVDDATGLVLGNHVTPIPVTLDGATHTVKIPLEMVAHTLAPGETVTLQLVASAVEYQALWSSGELNVSSIRLTLPTADAAAVTQTSASQLVA
jgi:ABC-2 type transport system ATP-binding protein